MKTEERVYTSFNEGYFFTVSMQEKSRSTQCRPQSKIGVLDGSRRIDQIVSSDQSKPEKEVQGNCAWAYTVPRQSGTVSVFSFKY